jgi:hypothetical protein
MKPQTELDALHDETEAEIALGMPADSHQEPTGAGVLLRLDKSRDDALRAASIAEPKSARPNI